MFYKIEKNFFLTTKDKIEAFFSYIGNLGILFTQTVYFIFTESLRRIEILRQMKRIGVESFAIVFLVTIFTGMVFALQSAYQMQKMAAEMYIASLVAISVTRELGPVLTALVVAGRCGAAITAEIGTMKVTEQIDALETLSASPIQYLVVPRFIAMIVMMLLLTVYADFFGILGGYLIGVFKLNIEHSLYIKMTFDSLIPKDIITGLIKSIFFALIICIVASFEGFNTKVGAEGVGKATTFSVVRSFILIVGADCFFTMFFYFITV